MLNQGEKHLYEFIHEMSGSFMVYLINAIFKADHGNKQKLALGFPEEVEAVTRFQNDPGYSDHIENEYFNI